MFAESGYKGTSTRKIAKEAGVSELTIYRCYKTKEELFRHALAKRMPDAWLDDVTMDHSLPLNEQLKTLFQRLHETLDERKELIRIFYRDGTDSPDIVALARQIPVKIWAPIEQCLCQAKPGTPPDTARRLALQIFSAYLGVSLLTATFGQDLLPFSIDEFHDSMVQTYTRSLS
ncbi:TetR/AcrR family transcriptional regulator [Alicyclobacillus sp. ALC3]|nr:TetR/AcrR family transcriptional regulator [Alicyclobacillus sp. ALC3]